MRIFGFTASSFGFRVPVLYRLATPRLLIVRLTRSAPRPAKRRVLDLGISHPKRRVSGKSPKTVSFGFRNLPPGDAPPADREADAVIASTSCPPVARARWGEATRGMVASTAAGSAGAFRYCPSLCDHRIRAPGSCEGDTLSSCAHLVCTGHTEFVPDTSCAHLLASCAH